MSSRYQAGIVLPGYNALKVANAPTIGAVTAGNAQVSVAFTAPACVGGGAISSYTAFANCGVYRTTGASSPLVVTGLTNGTAYTFKVIATNAYGPSYPSAASASATPILPVGQQAFVCSGTFSWVAPAGVTSVSVVAVGGGGARGRWPCTCSFANGGGGGALAYGNNITVIPGNSYAIVVGAGGSGCGPSGGASTFNSTSVGAGGGQTNRSSNLGGAGGTVINGTGGSGGAGGRDLGQANACPGGGGAGGYAGAGGLGANAYSGFGGTGSGGGGGGGIGIRSSFCGGGGGGVGILGQGANGAGSTTTNTQGGGGSGGCGGATSANGALYGGGASRNTGARGAVRIIWPGTTRSFPSTCTGNL